MQTTANMETALYLKMQHRKIKGIRLAISDHLSAVATASGRRK